MRPSVFLAFPLIPVLAAAQQRPLPPLPPPLHVQVDTAHHRVLITGGPYRVPVSPEMSGMMMVNFSRRQFIYPALERLLGAAEESDTGDFRVPRTIGVPMRAGQALGVYATWHNDSGPEIPAAYWRIVLYMARGSLKPRPIDVLPAYMDVNIQTNPEENRFNVPPGHFEIGYEFSPPLSGHLLMVTGHLHDCGTLVKLVDAASG